MDALADSTVLIHLLRRYLPALSWYATQSERLKIASITWLEIMEGAPNKSEQLRYKTLLHEFEVIHATADDHQWAMNRLEQFQFTHHIGKEDCLIASVAFRLQIPLITHNLRHMTPLLGANAIQPYR